MEMEMKWMEIENLETIFADFNNDLKCANMTEKSRI